MPPAIIREITSSERELSNEEKRITIFWISLAAFVILTRHSFGNHCAEAYKIFRAKLFTG